LLSVRNAVNATINAAVPEHSTCAAGTFSSSASAPSNDRRTGRKSRQRSGKPAVGGTSRQRSNMTVLRTAETQQHDAGDDADRALPAITTTTMLIDPTSTACESGMSDRSASQATNSRQKQAMPPHNRGERNIDFQSPVAADLKARCPAVSSRMLAIQRTTAR